MTPGRPGLIGPYRVIRPLGQGGMGTVVLAQDPKLPRPVAVKQLAHVDPELRERLQTEARYMAELQHPHLLPILDIGDDAAGLYIVMPFMAGGSAEDLVALRGPPTPAQTVTILAATAEALSAMHARGVVHRDVKPSNVLLSEDGDVYLGDFGLAWTVDSTRRTAAGGFAGTLGFTAPDIVAGADPSPATDTFSLGALGYFLLTGRPPFHGESMADVVRQAADCDCVPVAVAAPDAPRGMTQAIGAAMAADPALRPRSLQGWARDLRAAVGPEPVPVRAAPVSRTLQASQPAAAPASATVVRSRPMIADAPTAPAGRRQRRTTMLIALAAGVAVASLGVVVALVLLAGSRGSEGTEAAPISTPATTSAPVTVATAPPATSPPPRQARVSRTCGATGRGDCFLSIRTAPNRYATEVRRVTEGGTVTVVCQVSGETVRSAIIGSPTTVWVRDENGNFMTAAFLDAPGWDPLSITTPC